METNHRMTLDQTMEAIRQQRQSLQIVAIVCFTLLMVVVLLFMFRLWLPLCLLLGALFLFYIFWFRKKRNQYNDRIAEANILYGLCPEDASAVYTGRNGLSLSEFEALRILPVYRDSNPLLLRQGFSCTKSGLPVQGWEIAIHYLNRASTKKTFRFLSGSLIRGQLPRTFSGDFLLLHDNLLEQKSQVDFLESNHFRRVLLSNEKLAGQFHLYAQTEDPLPDPHETHLHELSGAVPNLGAVRVQNDVCAVYLANQFYTQDVKLR
ncbi:MAG: hypothetical protein IJV76_07455, partial [Clostridia bacterium]|nr:hypothetical protein [Clostridia bacterium]